MTYLVLAGLWSNSRVARYRYVIFFFCRSAISKVTIYSMLSVVIGEYPWISILELA